MDERSGKGGEPGGNNPMEGTIAVAQGEMLRSDVSCGWRCR